MLHKLHILLLTYNDLFNLKECLKHIYQHTDYDFKIFILDNGSTDGTPDYLKSLSEEKGNVFITLRGNNLGIIEGRNSCFEFSQGIDNENDLVMFLDADQFVQKNWLDSYLNMIENYDVVGIEAWKMREKDFYPYKKVIDPIDSYNYVGAGGLVVKKKAIDDIGLFDERYEMMYWEDPDLCFRAYEKGYKIGWNTEPVIVHNHSGPLLNDKTRKYFMQNWKVFQEKWKNKKMPIFKNG